MAADAPSRWNPAARNPGARALQVATCSLCGLERPIGLMVPDGGDACADLRWYCKDAQSCTRRWTSRLRGPGVHAAWAGQPEPEPGRAGPQPAEAAAGPEPDEVPAWQHV
jgi:hypothetical protein